MDALLRDVRYALRQLWRSPGFTAVAVLSLALGIGANGTIFSVASALLERPMDLPQPGQLTRVYRGQHSPLMLDVYRYLARNTTTFGALVAEDLTTVGLAGRDLNEPAQAAQVSNNFFSGLGVTPAAGTLFSGRLDDDPGPVVVLAYRYWQTRFSGAADVVGRVVRLNDQPFTVIGVTQAGFTSSQFAWKPDVFVPLSQAPALHGATRQGWNSSFYITGRLAAGRSRADAEHEILALMGRMPGAPPEASRPGAYRVDHARGITAEVRGPVTVGSAFLMMIVGLVLLIACANVANLLLARASRRRREIAIRLALGVTRGQLVRQLLVESVVLAVAGGAIALVLADWVLHLIVRLVPADAPVAFTVTPDLRVIGYIALLSVGCGIAFGLVPALQASRADVQDALKTGTTAPGYRRSRARGVFLTAQATLATVLLIGASLFLRSLGNARDMDPGFSAERVVDLPIDLALRGYAADAAAAYYRNLLQRVRGLAEVRSATLAALVPLAGSNRGTPTARGDADPNDRGNFHSTYFNVVSDGYFETLGLPITRGRPFDEGDRAGAPPVVIVNETLARTHWAGRSAVGQTLRFEGDSVARTVVGVAADVKYNSLGEENVPFAYLPFAQEGERAMVLQVRLADVTPAAMNEVRRVTQELDPALPLPPAHPIASDMRFALVPAEAGAGLLGTFGALALILASIGVYGVTAYLVAQRTGEIGLRAALGARPGHVIKLVLSDATRAVSVGLVLGIAGGAGLGKLVSSQLYGVGALDPLTFVAAPLVLLVVALVASLVPARRALRVDPLTALRHE